MMAAIYDFLRRKKLPFPIWAPVSFLEHHGGHVLCNVGTKSHFPRSPPRLEPILRRFVARIPVIIVLNHRHAGRPMSSRRERKFNLDAAYPACIFYIVTVCVRLTFRRRHDRRRVDPAVTNACVNGIMKSTMDKYQRGKKRNSPYSPGW